jgi:hypothetical protein
MAGYAGLLNLLALISATAAIATLLVSPLRPAEVLVASLSAAVACYLGAMGVTLLLDALRSGASVIIDAAQVEDRRQKIRMTWSEVLQLEVRPSRVGIAAAVLTTRNGRVVRGAPFRVGAHRRRGDQIVVPLRFLKPPPHISAVLMARLAQEAGGKVLRKPF